MKKKKKKAVPLKRKKPISDRIENYEYHAPVLLKESVDFLVTDENGIYVDGTLGGGGHSEEILGRLSSLGKLYSFDKDPEAIEFCSDRFRDELNKGSDSRLTLLNKSFSQACSIEKNRGGKQGILLDLGVSSKQLDESRRGFSYRTDAPIDMRFSLEGRSAEDFLNAATEEEIERVLRLYGEEPFAKVIARRIAQSRRATPLKTTFDLRRLVEESIPSHLWYKSLSRVFQAIRIYVNGELDELENTLRNCLPALTIGGRFVVISYHSLEDRIVKTVFKEKSKSQRTNRYTVSDSATLMPELRVLTPKPIIPNHEEILHNPRARSAKMRVAEKIK